MRRKGRRTGEHGHAVCRQQAFDAANELCGRLRPVVLHLIPVQRHALRLHADRSPLLRCAVDFCAVQERLGRDAADIEARAADFVLFNEGDFPAELGCANRRHIAAGAAADDEDLRFGRFLGSRSRCAVAHNDRQQIAGRNGIAFRPLHAQHVTAEGRHDFFIELAGCDNHKTLARRDVLAGRFFPFFDHGFFAADIFRSDLHLRTGGDRHHSVLLLLFLDEQHRGAARDRIIRLKPQFFDGTVKLRAHFAVHIAEAHDAQKVALLHFIARLYSILQKDGVQFGCIDFPDHDTFSQEREKAAPGGFPFRALFFSM